MTPELHALHVAAGLRAGRDRTCTKKIAYSSEDSATDAANAMNKKPTTRNVLEAYPCAFCKTWHVGRKMSDEELHAIAYAQLSTDELGHVVAHGCDRMDGDQLCDRCRGKWAEVDQRLPPRKVQP